MKKSFDEFLILLKKECKKHKVKCSLQNKKIRCGNILCGGYFDGVSEKPKLVADINSKSVIIHEYSHLTQWVEKTALWTKATTSLVIMHEWLIGKKCRNISKHINICRDLELDNEIRASKLIDIYDIGISKEEYIQRANAYIMFYNWLKICRTWKDVEIVNSPKLISLMSKKFDMDYQTLSPEILNAFKQ